MTDNDRSWGFTLSTGLDFTHPTIVDAHFEACYGAYRDLLHRAGVQPGWHVLDAGCGSGSFLPLIAELVGPGGRVSAIDLAAENVELATRRVNSPGLPCPVEVVRGSMFRLPYPDACFDAVWCANTVQYLDDDELPLALAEMIRVVRDGGVVAIKDLDASVVTARPGDPFLFTDFFRLAGESPGYARQLLRSRDLYRWMAGTGLTGVRQQTVLIEHFAPFSSAARRFYGSSCAQLARQAVRIGAPGRWHALLDANDPGNPLNDPHAYICEGNVLAVGTVRRSSAAQSPH